MSDALFTIPGVTGLVVSTRDFDQQGAIDLLVDRGIDSIGIELVSTRERRTLRTIAAGMTNDHSQELRERTWDVGGLLDDDNVPDLLVRDSTSKRLVAINGSTGGVIWIRTHPDVPDREFSACFVDDFDGDGITEYALGSGAVNQHVRRLSLHSGRSGEELWSIPGDAPADGYTSPHSNSGRVTSVPDLDGDGKRDLIVQPSRMSLNPIHVCSSKDGRTLLHLENPGGDVTPAGDVDGDGRCDLFRQRKSPSGPGVGVDVLDGQSGGVLFDMPDFCWFSDYAFPVALGDLDSDGFDDVAISDPDFHLRGPDTFWEFVQEFFGAGDAVHLADLTLSDAVAIKSRSWRTGSVHSGCVVVYCGRTHEPMMGVWGEPGTMRGIGLGVTALPDVSGDGWPDLLVADEDTAYVFAGPGRTTIGGTGTAVSSGAARAQSGH